MHRCRSATLILLLCPPVLAAGVRLASGDFPPYTGADLPGGGISTRLVREALAAGGLPSADTEFLPWKRSMQETAQGRYAATFPYSRNAEREAVFLFSEPLHADEMAFYARKDDTDAIEGRWQGKRLCLPLGWADHHVQKAIAHFALTLVQPPEARNCFLMIQSGRADLFGINTLVGNLEIRALFPGGSPFATSKIERQSDTLYVMFPRGDPDSPHRLQAFNRGLKAIRQNGRYQAIVSGSAP